MSRLAQKTILITGGTTGIGFAAAQRALEEGAKVAITGTNAQRLEEAKTALGSEVIAILADAGDVAAQAVIAKAIEATSSASWTRCSSTPASPRSAHWKAGPRRPSTAPSTST
jgi:NAD(P)-dependent dehydrogenase (short-subunit alcohol dehydrogenase family)